MDTGSKYIPTPAILSIIKKAKMKIITDLLSDLRMSFPITTCPKIAETAETAAKKSAKIKKNKKKNQRVDCILHSSFGEGQEKKEIF